MPKTSSTFRVIAAAAVVCAGSMHAQAQIAQSPLYLGESAPPQVMVVMGRDHTLYYSAYNDASDLTGNGIPDVGYKPDAIDYLGLFDSHKCYTYDSGNGRFVPASTTANKRCSGQWSGDFLNYLTTSRMDALRVVLYGGTRHVDTETETVLTRVYVPQDAHSWGKEYTSVEVDGYDISHYTPYSVPTGTNRHLFASTSLAASKAIPRLRVLTDQPYRIWEWVSIEQPVAGNRVQHGGTGPSVSPTDFTVRVEVCKPNLLEKNCRRYSSGNHKPTGLLHDFGEDERMWFGLLTGSYEKNIAGGVLRRNIGPLRPEINPATGQFTAEVGVIRNIDRLAFVGFDNANTGTTYMHNANCGAISNRAISEGECRMWGNPIAEMMYEAVRYFAGRTSPTTAFDISASGNDDATLGLARPTWTDPYRSPGGAPYCAKPVKLIISDSNPSYDSDQLPGSAFGSFTGDDLAQDSRPALSVSSLANTIWSLQYGGSGTHYIGETQSESDGAPTPKSVSSFNIRGLAPEEPTKQGSYYAASVARYGLINDLRPDLTGEQTMKTFVVALASNLPRIRFPLGSGTVSLIPYAKSTAGTWGGTINAAKGQFQPTNTIVSVFVQELANIPPMMIDPTTNEGRPYAVFRINFEDVEQGADHDMDAIVRYELRVNADDSLSVQLRSEYAAGGIEQHMGYLISGTTNDGLYLDVRDCDTANQNGADPTRHSAVAATQCRGNNPAFDSAANNGLGRRGTAYYLDTPNWGTQRPNGTTAVALAPVLPGQCDAVSGRPEQCDWGLPLSSTRTFTASGSPSATLLQSPLWYAAKYGAVANPATETWDTTGDGNPDNYFLVTNPARLRTQMESAFNSILGSVGSSSSIATNSTRLDADTVAFQARFNTERWSGELIAYSLTSEGRVGAQVWEAGSVLPAPNARQIYTMTGSTRQGPGVEFDWANLTTAQRDALSIGPDGIDTLGDERVDFIRGERSAERQNGGPMRDRARVLADIVNSNPWYTAAQNFGYDRLPAAAPGQSTYQAFRQTMASRPKMLYVGGNGGMLHAFDAQTGVERFAYVPHTVIPKLSRLTFPGYVHEYFVDGSPVVGDAYRESTSSWRKVLVGTTGAGGRGVFALDVTNPSAFSANNVLWEINNNTAGYSRLGHVIGRPSIARMANGRWAAIFGNGYGSGAAARLYIVDLFTGELIKEISTRTAADEASAPLDNGLSPPLPVDKSGDAIVDYIYAGDLYGNMWKFDVSSSNVNQWDVAFQQGPNPRPLFTACHGIEITGSDSPFSCPVASRQPITMRPQVGFGPVGDSLQVYFGTGKYFQVGDNTIGTGPTQAYYGIQDRGTRVGRSQLRQQTITHEFQHSFPCPGATSGPPCTRPVRVTSQMELTETDRGWYMNLISPVNGYEGERAVSEPVLRGNRLIFATLIPSQDACTGGGTSWLMEISAVDGGRRDRPTFDVNDDGEADERDYVTIVGPDGEPIKVPVSGIKPRDDGGNDIGIIGTPAIIDCGDLECKLVSGSSGEIQTVIEAAGEEKGRTSWRQVFP